MRVGGARGRESVALSGSPVPACFVYTGLHPFGLVASLSSELACHVCLVTCGRVAVGLSRSTSAR